MGAEVDRTAVKNNKRIFQIIDMYAPHGNFSSASDNKVFRFVVKKNLHETV